MGAPICWVADAAKWHNGVLAGDVSDVSPRLLAGFPPDDNGARADFTGLFSCRCESDKLSMTACTIDEVLVS